MIIRPKPYDYEVKYRHPKHCFTDWECRMLLANWLPVRDIKRYINGKITVEDFIWECSASLIKAYISEMEDFIKLEDFAPKAKDTLRVCVEKLKEDLKRYENVEDNWYADDDEYDRNYDPYTGAADIEYTDYI